MKTLREVLQNAEKRRVAMGHFNFSELTVLKAVGEAARELDTAVVVGVSESEREFVGVRQAVALVRAMRDEGLHVFLNADHTHSIEKAEEAARAGFDMVVFDASEMPIEKNITLTQRAVEAMKSINGAVLVEGEVGYIGSGSELHDKRPENVHMTEPADARDFVAQTRVDLLSPSVGTTHGMIPSMVRGTEHKRLDIPRIAAIKDAAQVPLTLHGGSGTDAEDFRKAIKAGITMIHINTELRVAWRTGLTEALKRNPDAVAPYKLLPDVVRDVKTVVLRRLELFGGNATAAKQ